MPRGMQEEPKRLPSGGPTPEARQTNRSSNLRTPKCPDLVNNRSSVPYSRRVRSPRSVDSAINAINAINAMRSFRRVSGTERKAVNKERKGCLTERNRIGKKTERDRTRRDYPYDGLALSKQSKRYPTLLSRADILSFRTREKSADTSPLKSICVRICVPVCYVSTCTCVYLHFIECSKSVS